ncbi:MAG: DMT family transporter [Gemmatimonadaceae bacterium]|nr:DMT family transporter [Gemmatimonadaceae bacterium]
MVDARAADSAPDAQRRKAGLVLALSVFGISWAAPLIRLSSAEPLAIAMWRLIIAESLLLLVFCWRRDWTSWSTLTRAEHLIAGGAGAMLAVHFWSWNASLTYTTVAASVVLVNLQPAIVAVGASWILRETSSSRQRAVIALALAGALLVAMPAIFAPSRHAERAVTAPFGLPATLFGDLLALLGAVTASMYYLAGRRLRAKLDLVPYVTLVYGWCTAVLIALVVLTRVPIGPYGNRDWAIFVALAAGPMLLGHTGMNWALKHLPAPVVNLTVLGEPVGASLLAMIIPAIGERPDVWTLAGGVLILGAAVYALRAEGESKARP